MFRVERDADIAIVRLDNPPVNAVRFDRWRDLPPLIEGLERDGIAAMVFTGLPHRHFCGGNDFREFASLTPDQTLAGTAAVRDALRAVHDSPVLAIAALHGAAVGSGFMLACACDLRLATADAKLGLPEVKVDAFGGYRIVREVLAKGEARMLALTGNSMSGTRAHQIGLVQELGPGPEGVLDRAVEVAHELAGTLKGKMRAGIKATLNREDELDLWTAYDLERDFASAVMGQAMSEAAAPGG
ncbi:enoyl-CoA hydratase/isomerase family protein [Azospirillum picis]|uniref:Enoyl-CoA hydratase/carnithine racemase n=1 Tax=Azospirillum picis TaxID=488438 RepID=A0ABU0MMM1_9PROT|nr:enoyl-CoA hydratase/isomerase family protein [Azospirillum picis]MBP2300682.1 enoyl-CoA hydratase/carnithine racemase [Azospirillum picis]MDQ0534651.1 enoyl-CoA hydratase/carnithine racemase [Azospirillum picis]